LWQSLFVTSLSVILAVRLFLQVSHFAVNLFFSDQWDFNNATLFEKHSVWEAFRWQHGPHRLGLGALLSKFLEPYFHWNSRGEAFLASTLVTIAAIFALYLKTRVWGPLSLSDIAIPVIFFTPAQYESLWVTPDFAHGPLPLLLIVLYCLALTCRRATTRYVLVLIINFLAIYTGFSLLIGFITPLWFMFEYYSKRMARQPANVVLIPLVVSLASLGSFFISYKFLSAVDCFSPVPHSAIAYTNFLVLMLSHFFGGRHVGSIAAHLLGSIVLGTMILVLIKTVRRLKDSNGHAARDVVPAILVGFGLLFCALTAYGRACLGPIDSFASRYTEYVALGVLGLYFYSLGEEKARVILRRSMLAMLLLGTVWTREGVAEMQYAHDVKARWRSCYLKSEDIEKCDQVAGHWIYPSPRATHLKEKLEYLKQAKQNLYSDSPG
jgi:hypothetical protein